MLNKQLYEALRKITEEETEILSGKSEIDRDRYMEGSADMVDREKLLERGKLISVRPHTRFIHFPKHTHNYVEVVYMCSGKTVHIINEEKVVLKEGELLFLSQNATQEIYPAEENDVAVNFIIIPEFFEQALRMIGVEKTPLREFLVECLKGKNGYSGYLHFKVADVLPVQNLVENLIWTINNNLPGKRSINQITMGLLFLQLMNHTDKLDVANDDKEKELLLTILRYIEENYKEGKLSELAATLNYDLYWLSRKVKQMTGKTYTELVQEKRLNQAVFYLVNTGLSVADIGQAVGYDNLSYFHRMFKEKYHLTPKQYRDENRIL